jgi:ribosomal protein S18 acetylase RimI-like enzyme
MRIAADADQPRLIALVNSAFAVETFLEGTRTDPERMAATMQQGAVLVSEDGAGELLASVYFEARGLRGYMGMLAVDPACQGKGLASLMVKAAEDHLRGLGCEAVDISVLSLRPELPPIYRRFGFVETRTEEFRYGRIFREDVECHCIVMSKPL